MNPAILEYVRPDREMFEQAHEEIGAFDEAFDLKEIEEDQQPRQRVYWKDIIQREEQKIEAAQQEAEAEQAKLGKDDEGDNDVVKEISSVNPIADFNNMINNRKVDLVGEAISQMQKIIERCINASLQGDLHEKAFECFKELRGACVREDEADSFNRFAERLKKQFDKEGPNQEFFDIVRKAKLSLITKAESFSSKLEQSDADFYLNGHDVMKA